jgi:hypothetical protein
VENIGSNVHWSLLQTVESLVYHQHHEASSGRMLNELCLGHISSQFTSLLSPVVALFSWCSLDWLIRAAHQN